MKYLVLVLLVMASQAHAQPIKVMSYNIRLDAASDGVNRWVHRKEKLPALIARQDPDVVGLQEVLHHQLMDILAALPAYGHIGVGRDDGKEKGEYSAILFKKDRLEVIDGQTSWLSTTPEVPGSKSWDAAITRILTWGLFRDKQTGKEFLVFNTHFDHIGQQARLNSAALVVQSAQQERLPRNLPLIITGDFNCEPSEAPYQFLVNSGLLMDARPAESVTGTYCTFDVNGPACRLIDHIFHSGEFQAARYMVISDNDGKYYPSDHLPVFVELRFVN